MKKLLMSLAVVVTLASVAAPLASAAPSWLKNCFFTDDPSFV